MPKYKATAYIRLSYTDDRSSESDSVANQRKLIETFVERNPDIEVVSEKIDDGYSGIIFDRPAFKEMMQDITDGSINCVIVKDLSHFGRNSIETGYFIERVFPLFHTRFISISDDFDSSKFKGDTGGMDVAFKYLISEYYSRDMSIKTKSAKYAEMQRGEYQSKICPYGYRKNGTRPGCRSRCAAHFQSFRRRHERRCHYAGAFPARHSDTR